MPRVGLNLIFLVPGQTGGMETYARELIARLARRDDLDLVAFVNRESAGEDFGVRRVVVPVEAVSRAQWVRGEQQHLPAMARAEGCDLVHSLGSTAPVRGAFKRVTTIHDLHYKLVPDAHFGLRGLGMRLLIPAAARRSHRVIVDAASTATDLQEHLGTRADKIDVVPLGVSPPTVTPTPEDAVRQEFGLGDRQVLLSVSAKRPHKNLLRLIEAHAALQPRPVLVIPGYPTPYEAELRDAADRLGSAGDVRLPAWVSAADLEALYATATLLAFPSLYEGFGLPVLEAMMRGLPVATSGSGSLAEVAGDAARLFDPTDVPAMTAALQSLLGDPVERESLRSAGLARAATFTWERTAELTVAAYRRALAA